MQVNMHEKIYHFFTTLDQCKVTEYYDSPTKVWIIDNFLPQDIYDAIIDEIPKITSWTTFDSSNLTNDVAKYSVRSECSEFIGGPLIKTLAYSFNSNFTINWLEDKLGESGLIPDPHFNAAGLCSISSGHKLNPHVDFNWHPDLNLQRVVNMILYTNKEWKEEWGGHFEIWTLDGKECVQKIIPKPNRLIFFTAGNHMHGFTDPLNTPVDVSRFNLISMFYKSTAKMSDSDFIHSKFAD